MCCFSPISVDESSFLYQFLFAPRIHVADTSIFARFTGEGEQCLIYSMEVSVPGRVAMILPVPVVPGAGEDALTFVSLEKFAEFFVYLRRLFVPPPPPAARGGGMSFSVRPQPKLKVHKVGSFEASFVPSKRDFGRLDERFRLSDDVWTALGDYEDWGFAVFQLEPGKRQHIHPMAFRFKTRDERRLFFPTVHVHDGRVKPTARFDHALFYQLSGNAGTGAESKDERSWEPLLGNYEGLTKNGDVYRRELRGKLPNEDTWLDVS